MEGMLLLRLIDCAVSTRKGQIDRGFPTALRSLELQGYVNKVGGGYQVTPAGFEFLKSEEVRKRLRNL